MLESSPEIDKIVAAATAIAIEKNHQYSTLEHLALAIVRDESFGQFCKDYGADIDSLAEELDQYLTDQTQVLLDKNKSARPKKTRTLERVFNRAFTQVLFSGRANLQVIDLFLSVLDEEASHASYFLRKYGFEKDKLINYWNKNFSKNTKKKPANQADAILNEYCTNLNAKAEIGRAHV